MIVIVMVNVKRIIKQRNDAKQTNFIALEPR